MKQQSKLTSGQQQEHETLHQLSKEAAIEFKNAEELLRYDAAQTATPSSVVQRLEKTVASEAPRRSWWRRLLS